MRLENPYRKREKEKEIEKKKLKTLKAKKGKLTLTDRVRALERAVFGEEMD